MSDLANMVFKMDGARKGRKGGFTLVELLIVIAIIGLLISLMVPSLTGARESARALQCSTNMGAIGQGLQMYADGYRDYMPASTQSRVTNNYIDLLGEAGVVGADSTWTHYTSGSAYVGKKNWRIFIDPSEKPFEADPAFYTYGGRFFRRWESFSYGSSYQYNWSVTHYAPSTTLRKGWNKGPEASVAWNVTNSTSFNPMQTTTPSSAGIMMDGSAYNLYFLSENDSYGPSSPVEYVKAMHAFRHPNQTANVLYMDGHVQSKKHYSVTGERIWRYLWANPPQ